MAANFKISTDGGGIFSPVNTSVVCKLGDSIQCLYDGVAATTYTWQVVYAPKSPNGDSSVVSLAPQGPGIVDVFNFSAPIDNEGSYIVKLTVDVSLPTEDTHYLRVRVLTSFGGHGLVAAGERYDGTAHIPYDIDPTGWTDSENSVLNRVNALVRRSSSSGRILYVDANRGRDQSQDPNDPVNPDIHMPGWDKTDAGTELRTGIDVPSSYHGDFASVQEAIDWADAQIPVATRDNPWIIFIQPGYYVENLTLRPHIYLVGNCQTPNQYLDTDILFGGGPTAKIADIPVVIETAAVNPGHVVTGSLDEDLVMATNLAFLNMQVTINPLMNIPVTSFTFQGCAFIQASDDATQGPAINVYGSGLGIGTFNECSITEDARTNPQGCALVLNSPGTLMISVLNSSVASASNGILINTDSDMGATMMCTFDHCEINTWGVAAITAGSDVAFKYCTLSSQGSPVLSVQAFAPAFASDINIKIQHTQINGVFEIDTTNLDPANLVYVDASSCGIDGGVSYPDPTMVQWTGRTSGKTLDYNPAYENPWDPGNPVVPVPKQLTAITVQDALDELALGGGNGHSWQSYADVTGVNIILDTEGSDLIAGVAYAGGNPGSTLALPAISSRTDGDRITIKDVQGNASTKNIVISPAAGDIAVTIDGDPSYTINADYGSITVFYANSNWYVV